MLHQTKFKEIRHSGSSVLTRRYKLCPSISHVDQNDKLAPDHCLKSCSINSTTTALYFERGKKTVMFLYQKGIAGSLKSITAKQTFRILRTFKILFFSFTVANIFFLHFILLLYASIAIGLFN